MKTRCMVVDDEPLAREVLAAHIAKVETLELTAALDTAERAFSALQRQDVDILFLDIEMPGMSGLGLLRALRHPPSVVITTAHRNYAVEGFELDVVDFLLKPIPFDRFLRAVQKYYDQRPAQQTVIEAPPGLEEASLSLRADRKVHKLPLRDILYAESAGDYVTVHATDRSITARISMSALEQLLPAPRFLRIHRSLIVSVERIDAFTSNSVEIGRHELTIGRNYRHAVLLALNADPRTT
ncbi:MAG: response regulator transcription factor [Bacteroidetes bacterium]|nr:response regulator transcription factor [Bacteroidota bacterium]